MGSSVEEVGAGTGLWTSGASVGVVAGIGAWVVSGMGISGAEKAEVGTDVVESLAGMEDSLETGASDRVTTTEDETVFVRVVVVVASGVGVGVTVI